MMQDDTLGVAQCGFKGRKMNNFLNTRTQIMGLQFGSKKCEKMHIGKKLLNSDICVDFEVDIWENQLSNQKNGKGDLVDVHMGKEKMKNVTSKKYLGQIIQSNGKSDLNVKEHTDCNNFNKFVCVKPHIQLRTSCIPAMKRNKGPYTETNSSYISNE